MKQWMTTTAAALLLAGGAIGFAFAQAVQPADDNRNATLKLADAPPAVRTAIAKLTADRNVKQLVRETDSRGRVTFDVEYEDRGVASDAEISESGDLLELSTHIDADAVPPAAANAIAAAFPNAVIKAAEAKEVFFYEVVVTSAGKDREMIVTANGQIGDDDDDEDSEDDDDSEEGEDDDESEDDDGGDDDDDDGEDDD